MDEMEPRVLGDPEVMPEGVFENALQEAFSRPYDPELAGLLEWDEQDDTSWGDQPDDAWDEDLDTGVPDETGLHDPATGAQDDQHGLGHEAAHGSDLDSDGHGLDGGHDLGDGTGLDADHGLGSDHGLGGDHGLEAGEHGFDLATDPGAADDAFGGLSEDHWTGLGEGDDWH